MSGPTTSCRGCGHDPHEELVGGGALQRCEVCGRWVLAPGTAMGRDLLFPIGARLTVPA